MLASDLLLDIRIRRRNIGERHSLNDTILRNLRSDMYSASHRALKRPIILTGVTFEERLREFERFLAEDALFNSADAFFVESATRNESSDFFSFVRSDNANKCLYDGPQKLDQEIR